MFGLGCAIFPGYAAVLPHDPAIPDAVEFGEAVWGEGAAGEPALGAAGAVEGKPIGGAADDGLLLGGGVAQAGAEAIAVFQISYGIDARALMNACDEFHEAVGCGKGVEIADKEEAFPRKAFGATDGLHAVDEVIRLKDRVLIHGDVVVGADHHAGAVGGLDEIAKLVIEKRPLGRACDEGESSIFPHGGDVVLGVTVAAALDFLWIPAGDIEDGG